MSKAIITNRIYMKVDDETKTEFTKELTYRIETKPGGKNGKFKTVEVIRNYRMATFEVISLPQGRLDLIPEGYTIDDRRVINEVPFPKPKFELRPEQQVIFDQVVDSCLVNAPVGWGKSIVGLHIAKKLGQKTLIVTHNTMLRDQWAENVENVFGMRAGIIGSGKFDIEDHAIVVGNVQTITKMIPRLAKEFGTIILDECLDYNARVLTKEHGLKTIGTIVNSSTPCHVLSVDPVTQVSSYKKVLRYFKHPQKDVGLKIHHSGGGSLKCTKNHGMYTYVNGELLKVPADSLEVGDTVVQYLEGHKSSQMLNEAWNPILLGLILGDGSLRLDNKNSNSCRISVTHGQDQFEYLDWKSKFLLAGNTITVEGKSGYSVDRKIRAITSKSFPDLDNWREMYVDGHKKLVPRTISDQLTKESWALIFQDDGNSSKEKYTITFSFCELDSDSIANLQHSLVKVFGITDSISFKCNKGFRYLRLNKDSSILFKKEVAQLVHPQLRYKLTHMSDIPEFSFPIPSVPMFNESFCVRTITKIEEAYLTNGYRYNIEVEDNHTYFANGILVANCHHVSATTFNNILDGMHARYRIGLSGTLVRKDQKHVIFPDYFGHTVYKPEQSHTMNPSVKLVKTAITMSPGKAWVDKINDLLYNDEYQDLIASLAKVQIHKGHKVLIVASRVEFLQKVQEKIGDTCILVTGATDFEERKALISQIEDGRKSAIAGSRQIFSEGISVNPLSCIILAEPTSNLILLEQLIGRIMRLHPDKLEPLVLDLQFKGAEYHQNTVRTGFYLNKGWDIVGI